MTALALRVKRLVDVAVAGGLLVVLAPVLAVTGILVMVSMGRPVLFRQMRPGLDGAPFELLKFRTMRDGIDARGRPLPDADRLTRVGNLLRRTSLDELPQLVNVLRGDMSLVGPRPLLTEYLDRYSTEQMRRHDVRPGITGLAQVSGRNALSWEEKFALDVWYVDHWSLGMDARILVATIRKVARREGISGHGVVTMTPFLGDGARDSEE